MKYLIYDSGGCEYKAKIQDVKKLVGVTYNYCGSLYAIVNDNGEERYECIYYSGEAEEFNSEVLKEYGIEIKTAYIGDSLCNVPFFKNKNLFEKYKDLKIEDIGKEMKY